MKKSIITPTLKTLFIFILFLLAPMAQADEKPEAPPEKDSKSSPWFVTPLVSSDPKISTAGGALAGYVHQFDEESPPSLFGVTGTYSTTDSWYLGAFAKSHFGKDKHRITAAVVTGEIRNDYSDFLGSGLDVQTTDDLTMYALRYVIRVYGHWYLGPQFISTNYAISGGNLLSGQILEHIGLTGFKSNGLGLLAQYDSRDNQYSPSSGQVFEAHNIAFREAFGEDASFDVYSADYQYYLPHGKGHVLALHVKGRWTHDAPPSGYSSVDLRGYTRGQYLSPHMTLAEADYRYSLTEKWGIAAFAGIAGLYGDDTVDGDDRLFPAGGAGIFYQLNDEKMVVRADFAIGKDGNRGFYLKFGQPF
ncbi:MAG: BamA/TamA family outer membrane protein [Desulfobacterales bacterium]|nr:BamA/TamA family outer membrane protein [Desulfobacterales bacterium]